MQEVDRYNATQPGNLRAMPGPLFRSSLGFHAAPVKMRERGACGGQPETAGLLASLPDLVEYPVETVSAGVPRQGIRPLWRVGAVADVVPVSVEL